MEKIQSPKNHPPNLNNVSIAELIENAKNDPTLLSTINIDDLLNKRLVPEFKPKLNSNIFDVSNFDKMFTSEEAMISVVPKDV